MEWLYLVIGIAVLGVLTVVGLVTTRGRRTPTAPPPLDERAPAGTDVLAPPPEVDVDAGPEAPVVQPRRSGPSGRRAGASCCMSLL